MKCICGYEYEEKQSEPTLTFLGWNSETVVVKGDEPFISLGKVTGTKGNESKHYEKHACPKCGTVKIEKAAHR